MKGELRGERRLAPAVLRSLPVSVDNRLHQLRENNVSDAFTFPMGRDVAGSLSAIQKLRALGGGH